jgi:hypothetical protein
MEAARCDELHLMARAVPPLIAELEAHPQPRFPLVVNGVDLEAYVADFSYIDSATGQRVVEDVKSVPGDSRLWRLKKALMVALHGIDVQEVRHVRGRR